MSDQCKHCNLRDNFEDCSTEECTIKDSWWGVEMVKRVKSLEEDCKYWRKKFEKSTGLFEGEAIRWEGKDTEEDPELPSEYEYEDMP